MLARRRTCAKLPGPSANHLAEKGAPRRRAAHHNLDRSLGIMADKAAAVRATASKVTLAEFLKGRPSRNVLTLKNSQTVGDALQVSGPGLIVHSCMSSVVPLLTQSPPTHRFWREEEFSEPLCLMMPAVSISASSTSVTSCPASWEVSLDF